MNLIGIHHTTWNAFNSSPSKRPLEIRMKKKRFVPGHFGHPLGGLLGQGLSPAMKQDEEISAIREQTNKVVDGLIKVGGLINFSLQLLEPIFILFSSSRPGIMETKALSFESLWYIFRMADDNTTYIRQCPLVEQI